LTGSETVIRARRKLVDATYVESEIPSRHTPTFTVDPDVRLITPNDLVDVAEAPSGFTVLGAGKTAMDACNWLLDNGVDANQVRWVRPRDPWLFNRVFMQPLELVANYMELQACWVEAAAEATSGDDFAQRLAAQDVFLRIDPDVEPDVFRGATISREELDALRSVTRVVRDGKVRHIGAHRITFEGSEAPAEPGELFVDCTAAGVRPTTPRPVFEPSRITLQYVTIGIVPWAAATIGAVETSRDDDSEKNRLCPPLAFSGNASDMMTLSLAGMTGLVARGSEPDLAAWTEGCRLNPARGAAERMDDPAVSSAFTRLAVQLEPALANLSQRLGGPAAAPTS
jgi:hypothetical protein